VYLLAGLPYKLKIWQQQWPRVMQNVISRLQTAQCKAGVLRQPVPVQQRRLSNMTEETAVDPPSKKGAVRAGIAQMLMDEVNKGTLHGADCPQCRFLWTCHLQQHFN
jgi:hypothetical protein